MYQSLIGDCIEWPGSKRAGYGRRRYKGRVWSAHRAALDELGILDPTKMVLHKCDNPACVNPDHLFQGTQLDNMRDMCSKGRAAQTYYEVNGIKKSLKEWAKSLNISRRSLYDRFKKMSVEEALTTPKRNHNGL